MSQQLQQNHCSDNDYSTGLSTTLYLCRCLQITEGNLQHFIEVNGLRTLHEVRCQTGAGNGCNSCHFRIKQLLKHSELQILESEDVPA